MYRNAITEARAALDKAYAKQFLELPEMQDEYISKGIKIPEVHNMAERNSFRDELRAAVNKMVGAAPQRGEATPSKEVNK